MVVVKASINNQLYAPPLTAIESNKWRLFWWETIISGYWRLDQWQRWLKPTLHGGFDCGSSEFCHFWLDSWRKGPKVLIIDKVGRKLSFLQLFRQKWKHEKWIRPWGQAKQQIKEVKWSIWLRKSKKAPPRLGRRFTEKETFLNSWWFGWGHWWFCMA